VALAVDDFFVAVLAPSDRDLCLAALTFAIIAVAGEIVFRH
jgi:hypothetical protein